MKNFIMGLLGLVLLVGIGVGAYMYAKDRQIKADLQNVEESQFVDSQGNTNPAAVASEINIERANGTWSIEGSGDYTIDASTLKFEFTGYKPGGQHVGTFQNLAASVGLDAEGNPVGVVIKLDPKSVKTDTAAVDAHLQKSEFFDTEAHPEVTVAVKGIEKKSDTEVSAITDITIKGITKTLSVPVKVEKTDGGAKFSVDTRIKISEWNMAFGPVQDEVRVTLSGELKKN